MNRGEKQSKMLENMRWSYGCILLTPLVLDTLQTSGIISEICVL